jgi:RecB family exonuclease
VYDGLLGEERPAALAEWTGRALAPTQLEEFATCPYRFLGLRVLRLETVPEPELREQISELDKGDLVHVVLRRFVAESCAQDPHQIGPLARLLEILEEEAAERTRRGQTGLPVLWRLELSRLRADLTQWWRAERARWCPGGDQPVALELRFGPPRGDDPGDPRSTDAPLLVRTASRTLRFVGRLDRVDRMATGGWRVIDYKTGNLEQAAPNQFRGGTQLQLPLYLLAVRHVLGDAGGPNVAEYVSVTRKGDFRRVRWEEAVLAGPRHPEFQALLDGLVEAIEQGVFPPRPGPDGEICAYCPIAPVCGPEIALTMARKGGDPAVRALEQIAHIP